MCVQGLRRDNEKSTHNSNRQENSVLHGGSTPSYACEVWISSANREPRTLLEKMGHERRSFSAIEISDPSLMSDSTILHQFRNHSCADAKCALISA
jgi:hypothetical protein